MHPAQGPGGPAESLSRTWTIRGVPGMFRAFRGATILSCRHLSVPLPAVLAGLILAVCTLVYGAEAPVPETGVSADGWAERGRAFLEEGSVFQALDAFDHAVAVDGSRTDLRLEYAALLKKSGFWLRSADQFVAVLKAHPDHLEANLGYGDLLLSEYQFAAAAEQFSRVLALDLPDRERFRAIMGIGSAKFGEGDYAGAAARFSSLVEERPNFVSGLAALAVAKRKMGDLDGAEAIWRRYLAVEPEVSRARLHLVEIQELRAVIGKARQVVQEDPSLAAAWAHLGNLLRSQPDWEGAVQAYQAATQLAPGNDDYRFALGVTLRDMKRNEEAARVFAAVKSDSRYGALALYNLAYCARRMGDSQREAAAWREAVILNHEDSYAYRRYIGVLRALDQLGPEKARAIDLVARAEAASPPSTDPTPWVHLALIHQALGDLPLAREAALGALRVDMNNVTARRTLHDLVHGEPAAAEAALAAMTGREHAVARGSLLLALDRNEEAEKALRSAIDPDAPDARLLTAIASIARQDGRLDEAVTLLRTAAGREPGYVYTRLDLSLALLDSNDAKGAEAAAREAIRIAPLNPIGYAMLGAALQSAGDLRGAASALENAVALDPMDELGAPRLFLAKVYGQMGDMQRARASLEGDLPVEPQELYRIAWEFVRDTYHDRTYNGQDWSSWRHRFDGRLDTTSDALGAVSAMLASLDDRNTRLRSADQTAALLFTQRMNEPQFSQSGAALTTSRTVESKRLEGNVGYIALTNLYDPRLPGELQKAVESMENAEGVILDLRGNQGGADDDVPKIAGMFVKPGTETGTLVTPEGVQKSEAVAPPGKTGTIIAEDKPVVVLVDRNTASSAENLAGSLKESNRAVLVGEKTYGKSGVQMPKLLPDGTIVLVVGAEHGDLGGAVYTGVGIQPDIHVGGASDRGPTSQDAVLDKARELVKKRRGGS